MFNFRFEQPVSFRNEPQKTVFIDDVTFSKNKLFTKYLTVPVQINFQPTPNSRKGFYDNLRELNLATEFKISIEKDIQIYYNINSRSDKDYTWILEKTK